MRSSKLILILSITFNLIMLSAASLVIYKKGGLNFIQSQVNSVSGSPEFSNYYLQRKDIFEKVQSNKIDKVFIGDSITEHGEFQEYFPGEVVLNRGISSDTSKGVLSRIEEVSERRPDEIYLMVGTNDVGVEDKIFKSNIDKIIDSFDKATIINIQSILPVNEDIYVGGASNERNLRVNTILKEIAEDHKVNYIDLYPHFADENGQLKKEYTIDGIHLTGEGYKKWVQVISQ